MWCKACRHAGAADLQAIIDAGQGDKPIKDVRFRCAKCGSRPTDAVLMGRDALNVKPWRADELRWTRKIEQEIKLGLLLRRTDLNDGQAEAVFGGIQGCS